MSCPFSGKKSAGADTKAAAAPTGGCPYSGKQSAAVAKISVSGSSGAPAWRTTKSAFVSFVKTAMEDRESQQFMELYDFLCLAFLEADTDLDGLIGPVEFDYLVERTAGPPRKFGFAPQWHEAYKTIAERQAARAKMFAKMDEDSSGKISLQEWVGFSVNHIFEKLKTVAFVGADCTSLMDKTPENFKKFCIAAVTDKTSPEFKELYIYLFQCFVEADGDKDGTVNFPEFDALIEIAAAAPRKHGFAPSTEDTYKNDESKIKARRAMFDAMDTDNTKTIGLEKWIDYCIKHIRRKVLGALSPTWKTDKVLFVKFITTAMNDRKSAQFDELYKFLCNCFQEADTDFDGLLGLQEFDMVVEASAVLPRRFGFAPQWHEQFKDAEARVAGRTAMFNKMDKEGRGKITLFEWIDFSVNHIFEKTKSVAFKTADMTNFGDKTPEEFVKFCKAAMADRQSREYKELHMFAVKCFLDADGDRDGAINFSEFDGLIEIAAAAPRKMGLAPSTEDTYESVDARIAARTAMFNKMDTDGDKTIGLEEWLAFIMTHIAGKVA